MIKLYGQQLMLICAQTYFRYENRNKKIFVLLTLKLKQLLCKKRKRNKNKNDFIKYE